MLILTRSGYPGSQKYGVALWSGDTSAKWKVLKNQVVQAVQFSISGIPYWTVDIGAFFVKQGREWYWDGDFNDTVKNPGLDSCGQGSKFYDVLVYYIKLRELLRDCIVEEDGAPKAIDCSKATPVKGGQWISVDADLKRMPVYIREHVYQ